MFALFVSIVLIADVRAHMESAPVTISCVTAHIILIADVRAHMESALFKISFLIVHMW